jgi:hypothetical protein
MNKFWLSCLLVCLVGLPVFAQSPAAGYQAGKIVSAEKLREAGGAASSTDAAVKPATATYKITIQTTDTVYNVRMQVQGDQDLVWINGKDVQIKVSGKKMYIKRPTGRDAKASILSTSKASTP